MNNLEEKALEDRQFAIKYKIYEFNTSCLCNIAKEIGTKYGMEVSDFDGMSFGLKASGHYGKIDYEVSCQVSEIVEHRAYFISAELIGNRPLLDRMLRCIAKEDGLATGAEYAEVGDYFVQGKYVQEEYYIAEALYKRALYQDYQPALAKLFWLYCRVSRWTKAYKDWDTIYKIYKSALRDGLTESDLEEVDPYIVHAVKVEERAEKNEKEAIREVASYYRKTYNGIVIYSYMKRLAEMGEEDGILYMSRKNFEHSGNLHKAVDGLRWHLKGAELGHAECMYRAGRMYELMGKENPELMGDALRYHEMAAQKGIVESMFRLSRLYAQKAANYYDQQKADFYLGKAIEFGHKQPWISNLGKPIIS